MSTGFGPCVGEPIAIAGSDPFQQAVGFHFAKLITEL
jgi:hypothetical protein